MNVREQNRLRFPHCSQVIDGFRDAFGELYVGRLVEGGNQAVGKRQVDESGLRVMSSQEFLAIGRLDRDMAAMRERKAVRGKK